MQRTLDDIIDDLINTEGGYVDDKNDRGGKTNYGITESVARAKGFAGDMRELPVQVARSIYYNQYVHDPMFDKVFLLSPEIAAELVDTGVNMGTKTSAIFFQRALNLFDKNGEVYEPLKVDGAIGNVTILAFRDYLANRKDRAVPVMMKTLNCLQGNRYIELAEANATQKTFVFGWMANRVEI